MFSKAGVLNFIRRTHLYMGVFIAPAVLFFAFTGVLQTFSLHEAAKDGTYRPPNWIVVLAQIHKKQTDQLPQRKTKASTDSSGTDSKIRKQKAAPVANPPVRSHPHSHNALPLKAFFVVVGASLFFSTISELYMSYKYSRHKALLAGLVLCGVLIPIVLLLT